MSALSSVPFFGCTVIAGQQLKALVRPAFELSSGQYQAELRLLGSRTYEDVLDLKLKWIGGRGLPANLLSRTPLYIAHRYSPAYHAPRPHVPGLSTSGIAKLLSAIPIQETIASGPG
jgi:hypothetical protein